MRQADDGGGFRRGLDHRERVRGPRLEFGLRPQQGIALAVEREERRVANGFEGREERPVRRRQRGELGGVVGRERPYGDPALAGVVQNSASSRMRSCTRSSSGM
jgi:hypothetical protein